MICVVDHVDVNSPNHFTCVEKSHGSKSKRREKDVFAYQMTFVIAFTILVKQTAYTFAMAAFGVILIQSHNRCLHDLQVIWGEHVDADHTINVLRVSISCSFYYC